MTELVLPALLRYATPEVFTVAGTLVGGFVAWKAVGWAFRAIGTVLKLINFGLVLMVGSMVGSGATVGWGLSQVAQWGLSPMANPGLSAYEFTVLDSINSTYDKDQLDAIAAYVKATASSHTADSVAEPIPATTARPDLGFSAIFAGLAAFSSAVACMCVLLNR